MKTAKIVSVLALLAVLMGCGHDFEGSYEAETTFNVPGMQQFAMAMEAFGGGTSTKLVIGPDYLEVAGKRTSFKKISERKGEDKRYLVFQKENEEEVFQIIDANTLRQDSNGVTITLSRIK